MTTVLSSMDSILASFPRLPLSFNFSRISEMLPLNFSMISEKPPSWPVSTLALIFSYSMLCRFLRFRRMKQKHAQYPYKTPESFANMTADDAYEIVKYTFSLEFPFTMEKAAQFALFRLVVVTKPPQPLIPGLNNEENSRTYGIPSISKLLCETKQFSEPATASKVCRHSLQQLQLRDIVFRD